jgi:D-galactosamine 6-phosphate deaminase/isomerase
MGTIETVGSITRTEIFQEPALWETTLARVRAFGTHQFDQHSNVIITGAGTSAHAATSIAAAWPGARAIATTDLITDDRDLFDNGGTLLSLARSGDSPESVEAVRKIQKHYPDVRQLAITCNAEGRLANYPGVDVLRLDPRTNDQSLAMTSSFSNLVLAGLAIRHLEELSHALPQITAAAEHALSKLDKWLTEITRRQFSRAVILASSALTGAAREASLKILELTAGKIATLTETYLGLRHGPMSFLREDTLVLCFLSSSPEVLRYERDLLEELYTKKLGHVVAVTPNEVNFVPTEQQIRAIAPDLPDFLRTPFEIIFAQMLAWHLSLAAGLNPDNPSPDGVINRVVKGVTIYED